MRVSFVESEDLADVEPGVHAGDDRQLLRRRQRKSSFVECAGIGIVIRQQLVGSAHRQSSFWGAGLVGTKKSNVDHCDPESQEWRAPNQTGFGLDPGDR